MNSYTRPFVVVALLVFALIPSAGPLRAAAGNNDSNKQSNNQGDNKENDNKENDNKENDNKQNDSSRVTVSPKVRKDVGSGDRARVLVQIRLPGRGHVPEGRLTHAAASLQRSDIAKVRGYVLGRLHKHNYRVVQIGRAHV